MKGFDQPHETKTRIAGARETNPRSRPIRAPMTTRRKYLTGATQAPKMCAKDECGGAGRAEVTAKMA